MKSVKTLGIKLNSIIFPFRRLSWLCNDIFIGVFFLCHDAFFALYTTTIILRARVSGYVCDRYAIYRTNVYCEAYTHSLMRSTLISRALFISSVVCIRVTLVCMSVRAHECASVLFGRSDNKLLFPPKSTTI